METTFATKKDVLEFLKTALEIKGYKSTRSTVMSRKQKKHEKVYSVNSPFDLKDIYGPLGDVLKDYVILRDTEHYEKDVLIKFLKVEKTKSFKYYLPYFIESLYKYADQFNFVVLLYCDNIVDTNHKFTELLTSDYLPKTYSNYITGGNVEDIERIIDSLTKSTKTKSATKVKVAQDKEAEKDKVEMLQDDIDSVLNSMNFNSEDFEVVSETELRNSTSEPRMV